MLNALQLTMIDLTPVVPYEIASFSVHTEYIFEPNSFLTDMSLYGDTIFTICLNN